MVKLLYAIAIAFAAGLMVVVISGCSGEKTAPTSQQAIEESHNYPDLQQKEQYLVSQAKAFVRQENFQEAMAVLNHVLSNVNAQSEQAKALATEIQQKLRAEAEQKFDRARQDLKMNMEAITGQTRQP